MTREEMITHLKRPRFRSKTVTIDMDIAAQLQADGETIARLEAERNVAEERVETIAECAAQLSKERDAALARVTELDAALKPFVAWCERIEAEFSDHAGDIVAASFNGVFVTFDDLRRARAALRPADKGDAR